MPVAWNPLVRVDESLAVVPTVMLVDETVVVMVGVALLTVSGSQRLVAGLLLASPE